MWRLFYAINVRKGEISILASRGDHGPVGAHQSQGQAAKNLAGHLAFLHPLAPRQCSRQLSHLGNSTRVKSAKSFNCEGQEDDALEAASFCCVLDFPLVGLVEGSTWLCLLIFISCIYHPSVLDSYFFAINVSQRQNQSIQTISYFVLLHLNFVERIICVL